MRILMDNRACYFCWGDDHAFMDCLEIGKGSKSYILNIRYAYHVHRPKRTAKKQSGGGRLGGIGKGGRGGGRSGGGGDGANRSGATEHTQSKFNKQA